MRVSHEQYERIIGLISRGSTSSRPTIDDVRRALNVAARAARGGHFQEAEVVLSSLPVDGPLGSATLDLKARLFAQQGRLVEAQLCWMEAVRQSPGNEVYRRSLRYVTHALRPSRLPAIMFITAIVLLTILTIVYISVAGWKP